MRFSLLWLISYHEHEVLLSDKIFTDVHKNEQTIERQWRDYFLSETSRASIRMHRNELDCDSIKSEQKKIASRKLSWCYYYPIYTIIKTLHPINNSVCHVSCKFLNIIKNVWIDEVVPIVRFENKCPIYPQILNLNSNFPKILLENMTDNPVTFSFIISNKILVLRELLK